MMGVVGEQCLAFGGNVLSVMTTTFALGATWKENTTVITPFYVMSLCSREGMCLCGYYRCFTLVHLHV